VSLKKTIETCPNLRVTTHLWWLNISTKDRDRYRVAPNNPDTSEEVK
jgi:hypothetical protein